MQRVIEGNRVIRWLLGRVFGIGKQRKTIDVVIWGKSDCSLCDRAKAVLDRLSSDYPLRVTYRDITDDPEAFKRYRYVIPVVELADGTRFEGKITEHRLRQAIKELT